ncbi:MAG: TonB-dependent receptor [Acidobacteriia bacterium]|nr:TonB-dependent receptor [Terriglobia bacterium]
MNRFQQLSRQFLPALFLSACCISLHAGTVRGTVRDQVGAVVPNATVKLLSGTAVIATAASDSEGRYQISSLQAGRFHLRTSAPTFASADSGSFYVGKADTKSEDVTLHTPNVVQQVVVTATGMPTPQTQVGASVSVLTPQDYQNRLDVFDPLTSVPGLQITESGRRGSLTSLFIRGGNSNANKLVIDGVPANDIGGNVDFSVLSATAVDHMEVFRGPNSVLYGSDALAGVVDITTRQGATRLPELSYSLDGGNFSTWRQEATAGGAWRQLDYFSSFSRFDTGNGIPNDNFHNATVAGNLGWTPSAANNLRLIVRRISTGAGAPNSIDIFGTSDNAQTSEHDTIISATWNNQATAKWHNLIRYGAYRLDNNFFKPSPVGVLQPGAGFFGVPVTLTGGNGFTVSGQAFLNSIDCCPSTTVSTANRDSVYAQTDYVFSSLVTALLGFRYEAERGTSSFDSPGFASTNSVDRRNMGLALEARGYFRQKLFYSVGSGIERNQVFGTEATPRASLAWYAVRPDHGFLRGTRLLFNFGKGVKEPGIFDETSSLFDLLHQQPNGDQLIQQFGIKPIGAERSRSYDGGFEQSFADRALLKAVLFHNQFSNEIEFVSSNALTQLGVSPAVAAASGFGATINSSDFRAQGVETEFSYKITRALLARGGYTYTDARVQRSFSSDALSPAINPLFPGIPIGAFSPLVGARPFRRAPHVGFASVTYSRSRWSALFQGAFVGARDDSTFLLFSDINFDNTLLLPNRNLDKPYQKLDLSGSYAVNRHMLLYASLENLLNQKYDAAFGFPAPRFTMRSGIKFTLGGESWHWR